MQIQILTACTCVHLYVVQYCKIECNACMYAIYVSYLHHPHSTVGDIHTISGLL